MVFANKSGNTPTWREMMHAILRNFGGLDGVEPVDVFEKCLAGSINTNAPVQYILRLNGLLFLCIGMLFAVLM